MSIKVEQLEQQNDFENFIKSNKPSTSYVFTPRINENFKSVNENREQMSQCSLAYIGPDGFYYTVYCYKSLDNKFYIFITDLQGIFKYFCI